MEGLIISLYYEDGIIIFPLSDRGHIQPGCYLSLEVSHVHLICLLSALKEEKKCTTVIRYAESGSYLGNKQSDNLVL